MELAELCIVVVVVVVFFQDDGSSSSMSDCITASRVTLFRMGRLIGALPWSIIL